jgi:hypothetical protein
MTVGKGHLMATIPLFVLAMGYNIWYFTQSDDDTAVAQPSAQAPVAIANPGPSVAGDAPVPVDPAQIPPVPDAMLDRLPVWARNPFVNSRQPAVPPPVDTAVGAVSQPAAEPEIVVAMVVHGSTPRARVNGRTVNIGDRVGSALVVDIIANGIVVESPVYGRRTITMKRGGSTPAAPGGRP